MDVCSGRQTFARYVIAVWLPNHRMEANTGQGYTLTIEKHLLGEFGAMRMSEILPSHVRDFMRRRTDAPKPQDRLAGPARPPLPPRRDRDQPDDHRQIQAGDNGARLRPGRVPIHLPEPVATLARTVLANRNGHATIGARQPSPSLFPGGQPGRPISTARLTRRLNQLGIRPSQDPSTALFQLATEIPAAVLARTLATSTDAAVTWQRHAAGDWITYAADVSRRHAISKEDR